MPHPSKKIVLTPEQCRQIEIMSGLRMPTTQIAAVLGFSREALDEIIHRDETVQYHVMKGRSNASYNVRGTLFNMAIGEKDENGKWIRLPDISALKFWCQTQEGFTVKETIEIQGTMVKIEKLSDAERAEEIERLMAIRQQTLLQSDEQTED